MRNTKLILNPFEVNKGKLAAVLNQESSDMC